jgi:hypothetical protein
MAMMNVRSVLRSLGALALLGLLVPAAGWAQTTLFTADFSPATLASWTPSPLGLFGNWSTAPGTASYTPPAGGGHTQIYAGNPAWTDYTVTAKVRLANGNDYPGGLRGRVNPATGASYAAWLYPAEGIIKLFRAAAWHIDTPGLTLLAQASVSLTPGDFHTLGLTFQGNQIAVTYEGATVIQTTDTSASALAAGVVALDVSTQPIDFDDVSVTMGVSPVVSLWSDDFDPATLDSRWSPSPLGLFGNWSSAAGTASYAPPAGGGHTQVYAGSPAWADYTLSAKFRLQNGSNYPGGIRGRVDTATGASYAAWIYPGDGVIKLFRATAWHIDTPGLTLLAQANVGTIATGTFHTLAITFAGSQITVAYDATDILQASDSTLAAGAVALDVSTQPIEFDDVLVTTGPTPPPPSLFRDDFASNTLANWTASPLGLFGNWTAATGLASYNGNGHTQIYAGSAAWTDYKVETKVRLASGSDYPGGLRGRVNLSTGASYAAWLYPAEGVIKLFRAAAWNIDTPGLALLSQFTVGPISIGVFHTLALTFQGTQVAVIFDGTTVIQVTDAGPAALAAGAIALDVSTQPIDFDDVVVTALSNPPPTGGSGDTDPGPGGPILVLSSSADPFTRYFGEILLAEGLNQYTIADLSTVTAGTLAGYDVAILGSMPLTAAQTQMLTDWVNGGGRLIAVRPDAQLAGILGLTSASSTLADAYLKVDTTAAPGQGIVGQTIQFHGTADLYTLSGATAVATLYSTATTATPNPAVTLSARHEINASVSGLSRGDIV